MGRFNKGLFVGGLLGATIIWLGFTKKGRTMREQLLDHAAVIYTQLKAKVMASPAWREMKKNEYVVMVREAVDKYALQNGLAEELKRLIIEMLVTQWKNLRQTLEEQEK